MAKLLPIGTMAAGSSLGSMDSISYKFFEPNSGVSSKPTQNILVSMYEQQTMLTRKKSEPYLTLAYKYKGIFSREYRQLEHFSDTVEDALYSFYTVDLSKGQTPSNVVGSGGDWIVSISNTRLYSTVAHQKAHKAFLWDGKSFKEGNVSAITTNTSITVDVDASNFGDLNSTSARSGKVYPVYPAHLVKNALNNFQTTDHINEDINTSGDGGFMYNGNINMISKYKV